MVEPLELTEAPRPAEPARNSETREAAEDEVKAANEVVDRVVVEVAVDAAVPSTDTRRPTASIPRRLSHKLGAVKTVSRSLR